MDPSHGGIFILAGFLMLGLLVLANLVLVSRLPPRKEGRFFDFKVFKDIPYSLFVAGCFFVTLGTSLERLTLWAFWKSDSAFKGLYLPFFYAPTFITQNGLSSTLSSYSLSILNAASIFGRVLPNYLADIVGPQKYVFPMFGSGESCTHRGVVVASSVLIPCISVTGILIIVWLATTNVYVPSLLYPFCRIRPLSVGVVVGL
jgi:hypothetical protein